MASLSAEASGIHVRHATVRSKRKKDYIERRGHRDEQNTVLHHRGLQVEFRVNAWQLSRVPQFSPAQENPHRNQEQAQNKNPRQDEEDQQPDVGVRWPRQNEIVDPEANQGDGAAGREGHPDEADSILAEVVKQACPVSDGILWTHTRITLRFLRSN